MPGNGLDNELWPCHQQQSLYSSRHRFKRNTVFIDLVKLPNETILSKTDRTFRPIRKIQGDVAYSNFPHNAVAHAHVLNIVVFRL